MSIANASDTASEALRLALDAMDGARECLNRGDWASARRLPRDAIEDAALAEKWEAVAHFAR